MESLADRRWTRELYFCKVILGLRPSYLKEYLIPCDNLRTYLTRSSTQKTIKIFPTRTKTFESPLFFPHYSEAWGNLSDELRNIDSINTFKSSILNLVSPRESLVFVVHDVNGVKLLTHLRLYFSHVNEHKFWQNVRAVKNPKQLSTTSCAATIVQFID